MSRKPKLWHLDVSDYGRVFWVRLWRRFDDEYNEQHICIACSSNLKLVKRRNIRKQAIFRCPDCEREYTCRLKWDEHNREVWWAHIEEDEYNVLRAENRQKQALIERYGTDKPDSIRDFWGSDHVETDRA